MLDLQSGIPFHPKIKDHISMMSESRVSNGLILFMES